MTTHDDKFTSELIDKVIDKDKRIILVLYSKTRSVRQVSRDTGVPRQTVGSWVNKFIENPENLNIDNRGRPHSIKARTQKIIMKDITNNPFLTIPDLKSYNNLDVSETTIYRLLKNQDLVIKTETKKIILSPEHKENRLTFAKNNIFRDFSNVIFSDEKKFNLSGPDCYSKHWSKKHENLFYANQKKFGGGSVMIHLTISYFGQVTLCEMIGTYTGADFIQLLDEKVLPKIREMFGDHEFVFQQDNASIHNAAIAKQYYRENDINIMKWPARSPDLNPVENVFGLMSNIVYKRRKKYHTIDSLWEGIDNAFKSLKIETIKKLYDGMKKRLLMVVEKHGDIIKSY
jgi:transposase